MAGRLKRYYGDQVYELIWLLKRALPCQLAVKGILQEAVYVGRQWHANGQLRDETVWKDGQLHGLSREWHANGQLRNEIEWKDGQLHGVYRRWDANGQLWEEGEWNGQRIN
jgi:antitoxin component YwqK of YwqJK toxin-antitoxin module